VTLEVFTGRVHHHRDDPDRLDITWLGSQGRSIFAPTPGLFWPFIEKRRRGEVITAEEWQQYVAGYTEQMRLCYRDHKQAWEALLGQERVLLVCFCADSQRCHRSVLAHLLARCGAKNAGELRPAQEQLPGL